MHPHGHLKRDNYDMPLYLGLLHIQADPIDLLPFSEEKSDSDWFLPYEHPTIVDIQYVCSLERMVASAMFFKAWAVLGTCADAWCSRGPMKITG